MRKHWHCFCNQVLYVLRIKKKAEKFHTKECKKQSRGEMEKNYNHNQTKRKIRWSLCQLTLRQDQIFHHGMTGNHIHSQDRLNHKYISSTSSPPSKLFTHTLSFSHQKPALFLVRARLSYHIKWILTHLSQDAKMTQLLSRLPRIHFHEYMQRAIL